MKSKVLDKDPGSSKVSMVFRREDHCCGVSPDMACGLSALWGAGCSPHLLQNAWAPSSPRTLSAEITWVC